MQQYGNISGQKSKKTNNAYLITNANESAKAAQQQRLKFYLISMLIRTLCFIGAVVYEGLTRWVLVLCAVFLPYVAVVVANSKKPQKKVTLLDINQTRQPRHLP